MDTPTLLLGAKMVIEQDRGTLFRFGDSFEDNRLPILLKAKTAEAALAGIGGRVALQRLYVAVTFTVPFSLRLTPYVDAKATDYADIGVTGSDFTTDGLTRGTRYTYLYEVALTLPYIRSGTERFRYAMQGTYFQVQIEQVTPLTEMGELIVESLEVQYKVLTRGGVQ